MDRAGLQRVVNTAPERPKWEQCARIAKKFFAALGPTGTANPKLFPAARCGSLGSLELALPCLVLALLAGCGSSATEPVATATAAARVPTTSATTPSPAPPGSVNCGDVRTADSVPPGTLVVTGMSCSEARRLVAGYAKTGAEASGFACAADRLICWKGRSYEDSTVRFSVTPRSTSAPGQPAPCPPGTEPAGVTGACAPRAAEQLDCPPGEAYSAYYGACAPKTPWWSVYRAESRLEGWGTIAWPSGARTDVDRASCLGLGSSTGGDEEAAARYQHFLCRITPAGARPYSVILHSGWGVGGTVEWAGRS